MNTAYEQITAVRSRIDTNVLKIAQINDVTARDDLLRMIKTADRLMTDLSKEEIACRRHSKITTKFKEITEQISAILDTVEQLITFARLMN